MTDEEILDAIRAVENHLATVNIFDIAAKKSTVTIPRKLANTLLGILESEYEGTEMFQDEINELKGLL